jgi:hypothetical protein
MNTPPRFAEWILTRLLEDAEQEFIIGDLEEIYTQLHSSVGSLKANAWYWRQIFRSFRRFYINLIHWRFYMFKNYLMLAFRHLKKH